MMNKYPYSSFCPNCTTAFSITRRDNIKTYCSKSCAAVVNNQKRSTESRQQQRNTIRAKTTLSNPLYAEYKEKCKFYFAPQFQTKVIGTELLKEFGIYNPIKNKNGLVRDHMYSIHDGFRNNIDPSILSHPANCQWMHHRENSKKKTISSITLEDLDLRIKSWNNQNN